METACESAADFSDAIAAFAGTRVAGRVACATEAPVGVAACRREANGADVSTVSRLWALSSFSSPCRVFGLSEAVIARTLLASRFFAMVTSLTPTRP